MSSHCPQHGHVGSLLRSSITPRKSICSRFPIIARSPWIAACTFAVPASATAQDVVRVPDSPACRACRIEAERIVRLGSATDPVTPDRVVSVAVDSRGYYYVAPAVGFAEIILYDAQGRFLRTLGRTGQGPGEFGHVLFLAIAPGDTLFAFDRALNRYSVFDAGHHHVRTVTVPGRPESAVLQPMGRMILHAILPTADRAGLPLHRVLASGDIELSFGSTNPVVLPDRPTADLRKISLAGDSVVSARRDRYDIELWTTDGKLIRTLERNPDWFRPWEVDGFHPPDEVRPQPFLRAIRADANRLWVLITVADANWKPSHPASRRERPLPPPSEYRRFYDTILEVIDVRSNQLLASRRFDQFFDDLVASNLLIEHTGDGLGNEFLDIWRVRLDGRIP
jgi:hypothetical protein